MRLADPLYPPRSASAIPESLTQPSTHPIHIVRIVDLPLIADWRIVRHPGLRPRPRPARFVLSSKRHPCTGLPELTAKMCSLLEVASAHIGELAGRIPP